MPRHERRERSASVYTACRPAPAGVLPAPSETRRTVARVSIEGEDYRLIVKGTLIAVEPLPAGVPISR